MAEKSLFFNAFPDEQSPTGYDRNYNADDISDWFSIVCATGVLKNGLAVSSGTGLSVNVAVGKATINGKGYVNNSVFNLTGMVAPTGATPNYYPIILRMDNTQTQSARKIYLMVGGALSAIPTVSALTRTESIYDLMLAYAVVQPNATTIGQIVDCRGDATLCPWFVAVKGYDNYYDAIIQQFESNVVMQSGGTTVVTNLSSSLYNEAYSLIDVYCNGLKEEDSDYTVNTSSEYITITFTATKTAGASISVVLSNFIDGEGLNNALQDYNQWVNDVENLKTAFEYTYICNGVNDNIQISNLINAFTQGGTDYGSMNLKVIGNFGYTAFANGSGTSGNAYRLFNFSGGNRKVNLDFTNCSQITVNAGGNYVWVFYGSNYAVRGLNLVANGDAGSCVRVFYSNPTCEDCRIWVNAYENSWIAQAGTFTNCRGSVSNTSGNSYCYLSNDLLRVNGGEYYAYTGSSSARSAVVGQSIASAVSILYSVNAPTSARSGYYQTNAVYQTGDNYLNCTDLISQLTLTVVSGKSNVRGTIPYSK